MGVPINLPAVSPQPHTHLAWEGFQYAKEKGKDNDYNHRVLTAFFVEGQDIGNITVLTKLAGEIDLNEEEFRQALQTRKYREAHRAAIHHACNEAGVAAVPAFVIGKTVLTGMQSKDSLEHAIHAASRGRAVPGTACGPEGCAT